MNKSIIDALTDPAASSQLRTTSALADYKSSVAAEGAYVAGSVEAGDFSSDAQRNLLAGASAAEKRQADVLSSIATTDPKGEVRNALATDANTSFETARDQALQAQIGTGGSGSAKTTKDTGTVLNDLHGVEARLFGKLLSDGRTHRTSAERAAKVFVLAALLAVVAAVLAAVVLAKRITRPLERLTAAADHLSTEQMPQLVETLKNSSEEQMGRQMRTMKPIDITSKDEIGHLAAAFNEVQRVAGEVAAEQAGLLRKGIGDMLVNLARRNQALLDRQIEFIDELEHGEEDPDQLEVEDFERIELLSFDEVLVASNAAADLAHLISELMENATNFSPPGTQVEVVGHRTKAEGYVISITDHGIGMSAEQIAAANESLAKPPLVGLSLSRSLGFIVVGRLAGRHGISVRVMPSSAGGVTALVSIVPSLIVDTPGGMVTPPIEAPARLKPVLDHGIEHTTHGALANGGRPATAPTSKRPIRPPAVPLAWTDHHLGPTGTRRHDRSSWKTPSRLVSSVSPSRPPQPPPSRLQTPRPQRHQPGSSDPLLPLRPPPRLLRRAAPHRRPPGPLRTRNRQRMGPNQPPEPPGPPNLSP